MSLPQPIRLRDEGEPDERPTWLELFFDLVFVVAVAQLSNLLEGTLTFAGLADYLGVFVSVYFAWTGFTVYASRFAVDDTLHRLLVLGAALAITVVSIHVDDAFHGGAVPFTLATIAIRVILIGMNVRAMRWTRDPLSRRFERFYVVGWSIALGVWIISLALDSPWVYVAWGLAVAIEVGTPLAGLRQEPVVPMRTAHIGERLGLFTLVVIGASVVSTADGISEVDFTFASSVAAVGSFAIAGAFWWLYFADEDERWAAHPLSVYGHYFLVAGLGAFAAGAELAILATGPSPLSVGAHLALAGGVALVLATLAGLELVPGSRPEGARAAIRAVAALGAVLVAVLGTGFSPGLEVGLLTALAAGAVVAEAAYTRRLARM